MKSITYDDEKWQLVPKEPTRTMLDEAHCDLDRSGEIDPMVRLIYGNMLYKAPQPPVVEVGLVVEPQLLLDGMTPFEFVANELYKFQEKTGCSIADEVQDTEALRQRVKELLQMITDQDYEYNQKTNALIKRHADQLATQAEQINHMQMALADAEALELGTAERCKKQAEQIKVAREGFTRLSKLGNEPLLGNSTGNKIAQEYLDKLGEQ